MFMGYYFEKLTPHIALAVFVGVWLCCLVPQFYVRLAFC